MVKFGMTYVLAIENTKHWVSTDFYQNKSPIHSIRYSLASENDLSQKDLMS